MLLLGLRFSRPGDKDSLPDYLTAIFLDELEGGQNVDGIIDSPLDVLGVHDFLLLPVDLLYFFGDVGLRGDLALDHHFQHFLREEDQLLRFGRPAHGPPGRGCVVVGVTTMAGRGSDVGIVGKDVAIILVLVFGLAVKVGAIATHIGACQPRVTALVIL